MKVGRVSGTVVATISDPFFDGKRLVLCDLLDAGGDVDGYVIAVDAMSVGVGETVLILDEGTSARQIFEVENGPVRAVVVGTVDELVVDGETRSVG